MAPPAAGLVQIQAGVDRLAQIRRQRWVNRKIRRDGLPLRIRQVARVASTVVLVAFTMFRRPHGMLLLLHQERTTGGADRCYTSATVKEGLIRFPGNFGGFSRRLNVRFVFACRVGRGAKCCTASAIPWTDRSSVEEFDVHPAKPCENKVGARACAATAAHGGIMQGPNRE